MSAAVGPQTSAGSDALGAQIARNSLFSVAGRFVSVAGWLVIAPWMLAHLGPERFGLWSLLTVISGVYATVDFGLASSVTRFIAEHRAANRTSEMRATFTAAALAYAGLGLLVAVSIAVLRGPLLSLMRIPGELRGEAGTALLLAGSVYALVNAYQLLSAVLAGLHRMDLWNRIAMLVTLVQLAGVVVVVMTGAGVAGLIVNSGLALLLGSALCLREVRRLEPAIGLDPGGFERGLLGRLAHYGAAMQVINLGVLAQFQLDKVLFGAMLSLVAVAEFEFALRVVTAAWALPALLLPPLLPAVAHLDARGDRDRIVRLYHRASRYVFAIALPLAAGLAVLAPALFTVWLGSGHSRAALATAALSAMLALNVLTGVGTAIGRGMNRPMPEVRYQIVAIVLHLGLGFVAIRLWGYEGGLVALVLSVGMASALYLTWFHRSMRIPLGPFAAHVLLKPLLGAVVTGLAAGWLGGVFDPARESWTRAEGLVRLALGSAGGAIAAVATLVVTRHVSRAELREIIGMLRGRRDAPESH